MCDDAIAQGFPRLLFMLDENVRRVFTGRGPWQTGFLVQPTDLPMDWETSDHRFVAINSRTNVVFGPFIQTSPLWHDEAGVVFTRKEEGTPQTYDVRCHWLMKFAPAGDYLIRHGLFWPEAAKILGVPVAGIRFRQIRVIDRAFERFCDALEGLNRNTALGGAPIYGPIELDDDWLQEQEDDISYEYLLWSWYGDDPILIRAHIESDDRD